MELEPQRPAAAAEEETPWVTVTHVSWLHEADLVKSQLEAEGIEAFVPDAGAASALPLHAQALGGLRVQVRPGDLDQAREILALDAEAERADDPDCPSCGSSEIRYDRLAPWAAFLAVLFLGVPLLFRRRTLTCQACGHRWVADRFPRWVRPPHGEAE